MCTERVLSLLTGWGCVPLTYTGDASGTPSSPRQKNECGILGIKRDVACEAYVQPSPRLFVHWGIDFVCLIAAFECVCLVAATPGWAW
jgi:hypothetical protein